MSSILTQSFFTNIAQAVYDDIVLGTGIYYYTEGAILEWDDELSPPAPENTPAYERDVRKSMTNAFRVNANDVSFVVPRVDWASGTVYDQYDDSYSATNPAYSGATSIYDANIYVLTSNYRIYKCISNNGAVASTDDPGTQPIVAATTGYYVGSDGYIWKFMGLLTEVLQNKFLGTNFMPVQNSRGRRFQNTGQLQSVEIVNGGSGYTLGGTTLTVDGDGTGATVDFSVDGSGVITDVTITNPGEGYVDARIIVTGDGTDAEIVPIINIRDEATLQAEVENNAIEGEISNIIVEAGGVDYTSPVITIEGDGVNAEATVNIDGNGTITSIDIVNRGSGYTYINAFISDEDENGSGAEVRVVLAPLGGHGHDMVQELYSNALCIFGGDHQYLINMERIIDNDFRQIGLLKNPTQYDNENLVGNLFVRAAFKIDSVDVSSGGSLSADDIILFAGNEMRVVEVQDGYILALPINGFIPTNETQFTNVAQTSVYTVNTIHNPEINTNTGELLFVDNTQAFVKTEEQLVYFKTYISF